MALHHSPRIVTNGLVLCLDAGSRKSYSGSGNVWRDLAGSNNGTLTNGPTFSSANGGSLVFDGANDFISTPINIDSVPNSLCSWFQPRTTSGGVRSILTSDNGGYDKGFGINNGQWSINIGNNEVYVGSFSINLWYYGVVVYSAIDIQFYINGFRIYSHGSSQGQTTGANLSIGNASYPNDGIGSRFFNGYISFCKIYNRALTPAEIQQNYNATKGRYKL
jgi:hypothetical protein